MSTYCSKCLVKIEDGKELCEECMRAVSQREEVERFFKESKERKLASLRKCRNCGKPMGKMESLFAENESKKYGFICSACYEEKEKEREILETEKRRSRMLEGSAFIHIKRKHQLANGTSEMYVKVIDSIYAEEEYVTLMNGDHGILELYNGGKFFLSARVPDWEVSPPLVIDIDSGETVFVEIHSKASRGPRGYAFRKLVKPQMVFPTIIKREIIVDNEVKVLEITK